MQLSKLIRLMQLLTNGKRRSACTNSIGCYFSSCRGLMSYVQSETPYLWKGLSCALGFFVMSTGLALCQSLHGRVNGNGAANARTVLTSAVYNKVRHEYYAVNRLTSIWQWSYLAISRALNKMTSYGILVHSVTEAVCSRQEV